MTERPRVLPDPLRSDQLRCHVDPDDFSFDTTAELEESGMIIGQARALEALHFGVAIRRHGYNIFALGPAGIGKHTLVRHVLEQESADRPAPSDWCYVFNFHASDKPHALRLPAGRGLRFRDDVERLLSDLRSVLFAAFANEEYQARLDSLRRDLESRREEAFDALRREAEQAGLVMVQMPAGMIFAPASDGEILEPAAFERLSAEERETIEKAVSDMQERLAAIARQMPQWQRDAAERLQALDREIAGVAVAGPIDELLARYRDVERVPEHLEDLRRDLLDNVQRIVVRDEHGNVSLADEDGLDRYRVNLFVDHSDARGLPIVYEDAPTYPNLIGRIEHRVRMGALITDFMLIKAGALQRANGGYLIIDARKLLSEPFVWDALKRALYAGEVRIQALGQMYAYASTVSLDPEPIPLDVKVVLLGNRLLYYLLHEYDPDFAELFKVQAEFDEEVVHNAENRNLYARLIAGMARREQLLPFDRGAVARIIEQAARQAADSERLGTHLLGLRNLLCEADHWARADGSEVVGAPHVEQAVLRQIRRADRLRQRTYEEIARDTLMVDTEGAATGQINGISVIELGGFAFGQPSRITATVRVGEGELVDIEREVETGGSLHSKGVLILGACLGSRYLPDRPLSISASLVFEQSYVPIDGDSASMAELLALLSTLARIPMRQDIGVTGSVDQFGRVQAIGAVNEKIEGFFDVCSARGLSGRQGVIIPEANVKHLVLRSDVVEAVAAGKFQVWAVTHVDQAVELLTDMPAGTADAVGRFPRGSFNSRVRARLEEFANIRHEFEKPAGPEDERD
ncbi:MAG: ATP-binding protein [Gammaproteobacteria bacterium]|nr:ATP-binding protein [Gammaproteobacteria bacterium]